MASILSVEVLIVVMCYEWALMFASFVWMVFHEIEEPRVVGARIFLLRGEEKICFLRSGEENESHGLMTTLATMKNGNRENKSGHGRKNNYTLTEKATSEWVGAFGKASSRHRKKTSSSDKENDSCDQQEPRENVDDNSSSPGNDEADDSIPSPCNVENATDIDEFCAMSQLQWIQMKHVLNHEVRQQLAGRNPRQEDRIGVAAFCTATTLTKAGGRSHLYQPKSTPKYGGGMVQASRNFATIAHQWRGRRPERLALLLSSRDGACFTSNANTFHQQRDRKIERDAENTKVSFAETNRSEIVRATSEEAKQRYWVLERLGKSTASWQRQRNKRRMTTVPGVLKLSELPNKPQSTVPVQRTRTNVQQPTLPTEVPRTIATGILSPTTRKRMKVMQQATLGVRACRESMHCRGEGNKAQNRPRRLGILSCFRGPCP